MIHKNGDYYTYQQPINNQKEAQLVVKSQRTQQKCLTVVGNVKENINAIRQRFQKIKKAKQQFQKQNANSKSIFTNLSSNKNTQKTQIDIEIFIPDQILKLDQRITKIQQKLNPNQIFRRKMQNKGPLVQRIKLLNQKLQKILQKSSEIIIGNIQSYCASLQDKEQYLKILYLRQALNKTKGMKQQILIVERYLQKLSEIQIKMKAVQPNQKIIAKHAQIIKLRNSSKKRIQEVFEGMKKTYQQILQEIQQISI